jgi:hypothetical protein
MLGLPLNADCRLLSSGLPVFPSFGLFPGHLAADAAQRFRGDTEVGSDLFEGKALLKMRVALHEIEVPFFGCKAHIFTDPALHAHIGVLQEDAKEAFKFGYIYVQLFEVCFGDHQQF